MAQQYKKPKNGTKTQKPEKWRKNFNKKCFKNSKKATKNEVKIKRLKYLQKSIKILSIKFKKKK